MTPPLAVAHYNFQLDDSRVKSVILILYPSSQCWISITGQPSAWNMRGGGGGMKNITSPLSRVSQTDQYSYETDFQEGPNIFSQ